MPSPEQLTPISVPPPEIVFFSPRNGITNEGLDYLASLGAYDRLQAEIAGMLPEERIQPPRFPRVPGAINHFGHFGEHAVTYLEPKPGPIKSFEWTKPDLPFKKADEEPVREPIVVFQLSLTGS